MREFTKNVAVRRLGIIGVAGLILSSCLFVGRTQERIPVANYDVETSAMPRKLVIVLPGRGDTLELMRKSGITDIVHQALPDADVQLVELTMAYYMEGRAVQRLHNEVIEPAMRKGYREIYLAGASMGGMGVLMYEREYPNQLSGLVLMAPYMGDTKLIKTIKSAGGVMNWDPGPVPSELSRDVVPNEEWRVVKSWVQNRARAASVWLVCGSKDQFRPAAELIRPLISPEHFIEVEGGHAWAVWMQGFKQAAAQIAKPPQIVR